MRIGVIPEGPLERLVTRLGLVPYPLVMVSWGMGVSGALIAGVKLGVFEALAEGDKTAGELAAATGCDTAGTETLLGALNGFGYIRRRSGRYAISKAAKKWLLRSSPSTMRDAVLFMEDLWDLLGEMDERVRTGRAADFHHGGRPPEFWERYMRGLAVFAKQVGSEIVRKVRLSRSPDRLLDVAGGHGVYSAAFCRRYPELSAEVLDLPQAAVFGRQIVREAGMGDRVGFREGDLREADWGRGYDVVLLFNILHNLSPEEAEAALAKAYGALEPGGTLVILDGEHSGGDGDLSTAGGFNELLFFLTSDCRAYPESAMRDWVAKAGFHVDRSTHLRAMPMAFLLSATR